MYVWHAWGGMRERVATSLLSLSLSDMPWPWPQPEQLSVRPSRRRRKQAGRRGKREKEEGKKKWLWRLPAAYRMLTLSQSSALPTTKIERKSSVAPKIQKSRYSLGFLLSPLPWGRFGGFIRCLYKILPMSRMWILVAAIVRPFLVDS